MVLEESDKELIEACRRGDPDAFRALFELHKDRIYSIALRYSGDPSEAMDIAQETFLKLFTRIGSFKRRTPTSAPGSTASSSTAASIRNAKPAASRPCSTKPSPSCRPPISARSTKWSAPNSATTCAP